MHVATQCLNLASQSFIITSLLLSHPQSSVGGTKTQVKEVSEGNVENNLGEMRSTHSYFLS